MAIHVGQTPTARLSGYLHSRQVALLWSLELPPKSSVSLDGISDRISDDGAKGHHAAAQLVLLQ